MSSSLDRGNDAGDPSSAAPTGASETRSSDPFDILDIRGGVRRAHGFELTDDNIVRAVESTIQVADSVLLAAARAADAGKPGLRPAASAAVDNCATDLPAEATALPPALMTDFEHRALQTIPQSPQRSLAQWGFAVSVSALVAVLIAGNPLSGIKQTIRSESDPSAAGPIAAATPAAPAIVEPAAPVAEPRLVVRAAERGGIDQAMPLGMMIDHPGNAAGLLIEGLTDGTNLSVGRPAGVNQWYVPAADLADAVVRPPRGFAGAMDLSVELQLAEGRVAERRSVRLEWVPPPDRSPTPIPVAAAPTSPAEVTGLTLRKLDPDEVASLRRRGEAFFADGDVAAARLMLLRAAEAADARAALALAATYDPIALGDVGIRGAFADAAMARTWYERAKAFGSPDAPRRLELLASREH